MAGQAMHEVKSGETLTGIAQQYGLSGYEPIWKFNSVVKGRQISSDPNSISSRSTIAIPLTLEQYNAAITKMQELKLSSDRDFDQIARDLDLEKAKTDRFGKKLDLTADVLFAFKGAGKAMLKYGSRYATLVVGKETLKLIPSIIDTVNPNADSTQGKLISRSMSVAADNSLLPLVRRTPKPGQIGKSIGKESADAAIEWATKRAEAAEWISARWLKESKF